MCPFEAQPTTKFARSALRFACFTNQTRLARNSYCRYPTMHFTSDFKVPQSTYVLQKFTSLYLSTEYWKITQVGVFSGLPSGTKRTFGAQTNKQSCGGGLPNEARVFSQKAEQKSLEKKWC